MARTLKNQAGGWLPFAWEEFVGRDGSHGASFSTGWDDSSQSTFQILIPWQSGAQAEVVILGYANFDGTSLSRTLPVVHPYKPSHVAERIVSAQPVHWDSKSAGYVDGFVTNPAGVPLSEYSYWLLTIGFHQPKYRLLSDADLISIYGAKNEWQRFVEGVGDPTVQMSSREGRLWKWNDATYGNNGEQLTAPIGVGILGAEMNLKWRRVPRNGLFSNNGAAWFYNTNILNSVNKVHNGATNLFGFTSAAPAGSLYIANVACGSGLRFLGAKATPIPSPFAPGLMGLKRTDFNLYYDVDMHFSVWLPPAFNSNNQGHNLAPNPDNQWVLVGSSASNSPIFPTGDLSKTFTLGDA